MKDAMLLWELVDDSFDRNSSTKIHCGLHRLFSGMPVNVSRIGFASREHCGYEKSSNERNKRGNLKHLSRSSETVARNGEKLT